MLKKIILLIIFLLTFFLFFNFSLNQNEKKGTDDCLDIKFQKSGMKPAEYCNYVGGTFDGICHIKEIKSEIKECITK